MKLANSIILEDGRRLDEVIDELEKVKGSNGEPVDLTGYVKEDEVKEIKAEIEDLKVKVEGITVPDISSLTNTLNQLIADLQAGKYNVNTVSGNTTTSI